MDQVRKNKRYSNNAIHATNNDIDITLHYNTLERHRHYYIGTIDTIDSTT